MASRQSQIPQAFDEHEEYLTPERRLMLAVIIAAVNDAVGFSPANSSSRPEEREHQARLARLWFERGSQDFQVVCLAAGLEPSQVRAKALAYIDANAGKERGSIYHTLAAAKRESEARKPKRERRYSADYIAAIANRAGVSTSTVSRVVYDFGKPSPGMAARVNAAIQEIDAEREAA